MVLTGTPNSLIAQIALANLEPAKTYKCEVTEPKKRRSLDANAYYWAILHRFAEWAGVSETWLHNDMIEHYGQPMRIDERPVYAVMVDNADYKNLTYIHLRATSELQTGKDGKSYRTYMIMRGSHEYNTAEFSRLVDGLVQSIQGSGAPIETMTPDELERLKGYAPSV